MISASADGISLILSEDARIENGHKGGRRVWRMANTRSPQDTEVAK